MSNTIDYSIKPRVEGAYSKSIAYAHQNFKVVEHVDANDSYFYTVVQPIEGSNRKLVLEFLIDENRFNLLGEI